MPRPQKDPSDRRQRWDALYVTPAERASIQSKAKKADLSVSRYLVALHAKNQVSNRSDWRRNIQLLNVVTEQLGLIARSIPQEPRTAEACDELAGRLEIAASLLEIERLIRSQVMPWQGPRQLDPVDHAKAAPC
ncbi:hypothetical protein T8A63_19760 (plasmid) [Sulfitobacter sp. OXR-159]|uniref:plasmid mobilization protein n=1 Tax=Sulfitobacter sp. OXR-159 TaxID=3100174 RepID=UPI002AC93291|nr:hypothetical protein [Sulfitobacter sp. OXR-159]WPZ31566.1 hypothetical protein T8A63_19760 [Sulfitobacter sp. OXR-159]